jgi:hypothetical protein
LIHKKHKPKIERYDVANLLSDPNVKMQYQTALSEELCKVDSSKCPTDRLEDVFEIVRKCASSTIGILKPSQQRHFSQDSFLCALIDKRSKLRTQLSADNSAIDRTTLRTQVNKAEKEIQNRLSEIAIARADNLCESINNTDSSRQMYAAVKELANVSKKSSIIYVHNKKGLNICSDEMKASTIQEYFKEQFTDATDGPLPAFEGDPAPLTKPISYFEVEDAVAKLKNGKSNGPDNIPNELLKAWHPDFNHAYAEIINESFATQTHIPSIGKGILTPLQKPGKPKGPLKSLRPLMLLNGSRKILSLITLKRICNKIDTYTGPWQAAYKNSRSCADIVWAQRMLISVVKNKEWEYSKMGIDMSAAFDTIKRKTILRLLETAGCTDDEVRLVRYLLSNTKLQVRVKQELSDWFESSIGAFQGDSLSGKLFTLVLAGGLYELREKLERCEPPISIEGVPEEWEYADDVDFGDEEMEQLIALFPDIKQILSTWNLFVNDTKTEFARIHLADPKELTPSRKSIRKEKLEPWRKNKSLGSLLCSEEDINRRCQLGNLAFSNFDKVWLQGPKIPLRTKIKLYDSLVASVILYNSNSWAAPAVFLDKLDITHRKHLRRILNIYWPKGVISNTELYKRCNTNKLSERACKYRWTMFGHILRRDEQTPAFASLKFAICNCHKSRKGRHQSNLLNLLIDDLKVRNLKLDSIGDLYNLRRVAFERAYWRNCFVV